MIYSDRDIEIALSYGAPRGLTIEGLVPGSVQPASVDFHLSDRPFKVWERGVQRAEWASPDPIVPWTDQADEMISVPHGQHEGVPCFRLEPGQFALASTTERVEIGSGMAGRLEGKSSLARLGLVVHTTAGFFDPGFQGYPTLELLNVSPRPMLLRPGMPIAQMAFFRMTSEPKNLYGALGKYDGQGADPTASRYFENFLEEGVPTHTLRSEPGFVVATPIARPLIPKHSCEWCAEPVAHIDPDHPEDITKWVHVHGGVSVGRACMVEQGGEYPNAWPHGMGSDKHHDGGN